MADLSSLVIRLSADVAQLQGDLGRANAIAQRSAASMQGSFQTAFDTMGGLAKSFAIGLASSVGIGSLASLGKQAIDTADQMGKMAQKVGISVETLSSLGAAAKLSDVSLEGLQGGLARLARNATDAAAGSKEQAAAFTAMGLSVKDATGNLKPMEQILADVAGKFASYRDGAEKTALAQRLFGKAGADLIVLLNDLGTQGFAEVIKQARAFNQVIGPEQAQQSQDFNDNLTRIQMSVSGFANAVMREALPSLVSLTGDMADGAKTNDGYASTARTVAEAIVETVKILRDLSTVLSTIPGDIRSTANAFNDFSGQILGTNNELVKLLELMPQVKKSGTGLFKFPEGKDGLLPGVAATREFFDWLTTPTAGSPLADKMGLATLTPQIDKLKSQFQIVVGDVSNVTEGFGSLATHVATAGNAAEKARPPMVGLGGATGAGGRAARAAKQEYVAYSAALGEAGQAAQRLKQLAQGLADDVEDIRARMAGADETQIAYNKSLREIQENYTKIYELGPPTAQVIEDMGVATEKAGERMDLTRVYDQQQDAMEKYRAELQKTADMWGNFSDAVFDAVTKSGNFLKNLLDNLKSVVLQMLKEWARTKVIGYFTGQSGGTGGGWGSLVNAGLSAYTGGGGGGVGGLVGSYTGGSSGNGLIGSAGNAYQTGTSMWDGFKSGWNSMFGSGAYTGGGGAGGYVGSFSSGAGGAGGYAGGGGAGGYVGEFSSAGGGAGYGGYGSAWGQAAGVVGGAYAGYNRYQQSDGGVAGVAGAAAYGYGTYAVGMGMMSGMAAIPVVGWIAIALMLVDMFSGGKLFGTKGKMEGGSTALNIDSSGANYTTGISLKGQQALFGGAKWSWEEIAQTEEQKKAAQEFFDGMTQTMTDYAKHYGVDAGALLSASFEQKFDKKGNLTGETTSIIGGHTYDKLDSEGFAQAYVSANQLEVLSQFDDKLKGTIDQYLDSVDELNSIAVGLSQTQDMLAAGGHFLGITGEQTLSSVVQFAEGVRHGGELIGDAIQRLIQAQAQYDQFVSQFKPAKQFVDEFEASLSGIRDQMMANIKQADALAVAAGAAGAAQADLANIYEYAAHQAAQALLALEQSAQSLAFGLGITTIGSLDQVNSEIARLQGKANAGAGAVQSFGNTMQAVAQQATDAMNLLLGDLSPLNDQTKLQKALEGLRAGTVSQEQVLQIGRRLYASSQAYNDLFSMVTSMARGGGNVTGSSGRTGGTGASGGLTGAEQQRLSDLLKEQQQLQAAAQLAQYQSLAKQIAEIAAAKGEDWRVIAEQMGINIAQFEAGLQMTDEQTDSYIDTQQSLLDDNKENTQSLIAAINNMSDAVVVALGGTPAAHSEHGNPNGTDTPDPRGTGHSTRPYQVGAEMARGFRDVTSASLPRSGRERVRA